MIKEPLHVWGCGTARTLRVHWAMFALNLPYISHPIVTRSADMEDKNFLAVSPGKKIPALSHGELNLTESAAIIEYLFHLAGKHSNTIENMTEINRWSYFTLMEIDATALYVLRRHQDLSAIYGEAPKACEAARNYFYRQIKVLDKFLGHQKPFVVGDQLSKLDIILGSCCLWAQSINLELPCNVERWFTNIQLLKSFESGLRANAE